MHKNFKKPSATKVTADVYESGQRFIKVNINNVHLAVFADAVFLSNTDRSSQLEYLLDFVDAEGKVNIFCYGSHKPRHVAKSIFIAAHLPFINVFDIAGTMREIIDAMLKRTED